MYAGQHRVAPIPRLWHDVQTQSASCFDAFTRVTDLKEVGPYRQERSHYCDAADAERSCDDYGHAIGEWHVEEGRDHCDHCDQTACAQHQVIEKHGDSCGAAAWGMQARALERLTRGR